MQNFRAFLLNIMVCVFVIVLMLVGSPIVSARLEQYYTLKYYIAPDSDWGVELADNIITWQTASGGWNKNIDFMTVTWKPGKSKGPINRHGQEMGTFDNGASIKEMRFLAAVYQATGFSRYKDSFMRGLDWMLEAQYPSGGWPQFYPLRGGYWDHVTYNDDAMIRILFFIQEILENPLAYDFIGEDNFERLQRSFEKGIDYILKSQIEVNGYLTAWCQQHDPVTYKPTMARSYEHPAIAGHESVGIVYFLMSIKEPSEEVQEAILSALEWFEISELPNGKWARFYEIGTNIPIFSGRDGIIRYFLEDIEEERQTGYSWYPDLPQHLMERVRASNLLVQLRESIPEHRPLTLGAFDDPAIVKFHYPNPEPCQTIQGDLPVHVEIFMRNFDHFEQVVLKINDKEIFRGDQTEVKLIVDTLKLDNGVNTLKVETLTEAGVSFAHSVNFVVDNL